MKIVLTVAAYASALGLLLGLARRYVLRPFRNAITDLRQLIAQIRSADHIAVELTQLAGAVTNMAVALMSAHEEDRQRLDDTVTLVVDLSADIARLTRKVAELQTAA